MNIVIKNGTIVSSDCTYKSDLQIENGVIVNIAKNIIVNDSQKLIDASGKYVIPGGIDPHVHMQLPTPAGPSSDDFYSGSVAALFGGTTSFIDFVTPKKNQSIYEALELRKTEASKSLVNYSFHASPVEWNDNTEEQIKQCFKHGITSFKVYLAYKNTVGLDYDNLFKVMKTVSQLGGIVTLHCEDGDSVEELRNKYADENNLSPLYHALSRPAELEANAVQKAIELAYKSGCTIYIVHVSSKLSLQLIEKAQKNGQKVFAETCPHYLLLNDECYQGSFEKSVPYVISPPLRKEEDNVQLWAALNSEIIQTVATDHCPFNFNQKAVGINDFRKIPNGAGSVEHRLALMFTYGFLQNRISINKWVDLCCTQPAKIFGLHPLKGEIAVGSDADVVVWNPSVESIISVNNHHQNCDIEIYEGFKTFGKAETVISNGIIYVENNKLITADVGKFIERKVVTI